MKPSGYPIPMNQQLAYPAAAPGLGYWTTGLCDCFSDCSACCLTFWCPCITFGRVAEIVDKGQSSCCGSGCLYTLLLMVGCQWVYSCTFRSKLKMQLDVEPSTCADCCSHFWCECCALSQEYRELKNRGYVMSLGWNGNMARQNQGIYMGAPPMVPGGMMR